MNRYLVLCLSLLTILVFSHYTFAEDPQDSEEIYCHGIATLFLNNTYDFSIPFYGNTLVVEQRGIRNNSEACQTGLFNIMVQKQSGYDNYAFGDQSGYNNKQFQIEIGNGNCLIARQYGSNNLLIQYIRGNALESSIEQHGDNKTIVISMYRD